MNTPSKIIITLLAVAAASIGAIYLAGVFMLMFNKAAISQVEFTTYFRYWHFFGNAAAQAKPLRISAIGAALICYGLPLGLVVVTANGKRRALHGAARFANAMEIRLSGLLADNGIIVGKWRNRYLMLPDQRFVLLAAPIRSGKGAGVVIPNALNWPDSLVVLDVKQEIYNLTAGFRARHGQEVYLFNPFAEDYRTARYNPLGYVRDGDFQVGDLIAIGEVFYPSGGKDAFFDDQARNLFVGLGLYLCETPSLPRTVGEMLRQSSGKGQSIKDYLQGIINTRNFILDAEGNVLGPRAADETGLPPLSAECVDALNRFLSTSDNTRSSILASFNAPLGIWMNPIVDAATSANDFDLRDVRKRRMTVYVGITPDHLLEAGRLVKLLYAQLINLNTKELPEQNPALKYQCHMLFDEFTAIGKLGIIAKAIPYMAGYNLRATIIIQSLAQLRAAYGAEDARTITTNCGLQILYAPREQQDANDYSEMLGYETVKGKSTSRQIGGRGGRNESESDQRRALLLPQEIKELGPDREIIVMEGVKPILCDKIRYYKDPVFSARLLPAPAVPMLDMDTHRAIMQSRTREMTQADVEAGIDLRKLALDTSKIVVPSEGDLSVGDVQHLVDNFFSMLDEADCAEDGTSAPLLPEERARLDEATRNESSFIALFDNENNIDVPTFDYDELIDLAVLTRPGLSIMINAEA